jgi:surface antigen
MAQSGNPLNSIFSCQASGNKQAGGAAVGAILGGVLGNTTSGKRNRGVNTALGAALGAAAGSYVGCRMQTSDQQRAEAATQRALQYGENTDWTNPETGAYGRVNVISSNPYDDGYDRRDRYNQSVSLSGVRFASGVQTQRNYLGAAGRYQTAGRVSLRSAPTRDSNSLGRLEDGETFEALARVHGYNGDWLLVGRNRTAIGYVSEERVTPVQPYAYDDGRDRDRDQYARGGVDNGRSQRMCRTFEQVITTGRGETDTQRYTACQTPSGEWVVQA